MSDTNDSSNNTGMLAQPSRDELVEKLRELLALSREPKADLESIHFTKDVLVLAYIADREIHDLFFEIGGWYS